MRKVYPHTIYKHFKGRYYGTIDKSMPCTTSNLEALKNSCSGYHYYIDATIVSGDEHRDIKVLLLATNNNSFNLYHNVIDSKEELVLYRSLYDNSGVYARYIDDFLSPVDRDKYPDAKQDNRFDICINIGVNS